MFGSRSRHEQEERPDLLERTFGAGWTRIAVGSLHRGAGSRTVLESVAAEFHRRGIPVGVTRAPRVRLEAEDERQQVEALFLPEGTIVATPSTLADGETPLERLESAGARTALGEVALYRVARSGSVTLYGPDDPASLAHVMARLEALSGGLALVDGAWERRGFAAPDVAHGVVLVVGSAFSSTPEGSAAAVRQLVDVLRVPSCEDGLRRTWEAAAAEGRPAVLDATGQLLCWLVSDVADPVPALVERAASVATIVLPDRLRNEFIAPLSRSALCCTLVVRDPTRIDVAPVHWASWVKKAGTVRAVETMQVLAVVTNPVNPAGPDADAGAFRRLVSEALPDLPVHDVRLESAERNRGPRHWWARGDRGR